MAKCGFILIGLFVTVWLGISRIDTSYAGDIKPTAEEVVAKHLEFMGGAEAIAAIKSRAVYGLAAVQRPIGTVPQVLPVEGTRRDPSNFLFGSTEGKLGMLMKFYDKDYPSEHFAFDGKSVTVGFLNANIKSALGIFLDLRSGLMREGLWGGTLSTNWPLLHWQEKQFKLKVAKKEDLYELTYMPKSRRYLDSIVIRMYFDSETYRHVMTEYRLMGVVDPVEFIFEKFGNYKKVDGVTLPHSYSIEYNRYRSDRPMLWRIDVKQIVHGEAIDDQLFHVR